MTNSSAAGTLTLLRSLGNNSFSVAGTVTLGSSSDRMSVADFNNDGQPDLVLGAAYKGSATVFLNHGSFNFVSSATVSVGNSDVTFFAFDYDGDGTLDLLSGNNQGSGSPFSAVTILHGNGDGTFSSTPQNLNYSFFCFSLAAGDWNNDGRIDLALAYDFNSVGEKIVLRKPDGTFDLPQSIIGSANPASMAADLNHDGNLDLISGSYSLLGDGTGNFSAPIYNNTAGGIAAAGGDFNSDGNIDCAFIRENLPATYKLDIILGNGDGTFGAPVTYTAPSPTSAITAVDLNGDGKLDLVLAGQSKSFLTAMINAGDGTFTPGIQITSNTRAIALASADFNADGIPDIAMGSTHGRLFGARHRRRKLRAASNTRNAERWRCFTACCRFQQR